MDLRVGFGYDIHRFAEGRKLFLGGVEIPSEVGLEGYSDADVLLHAICDAILGAVSEKDIGEHFPDTDEKNKDIRSRDIYDEIKRLYKFSIVNIDTTVVTEIPNLSPYKQQIRNNLASILDINEDRISIKAKTNESMGAIGEKKAIACFAVVLLKKTMEV
jgi:2-C-methyl-D-erythritol 2,4-cyclodiphosphate synthase